ncbi:hypothetical protein ACQP2E_35090 [Actinoplanes sp. CA-015351]|uniref:hypothetical protein n=1 Tax=Actinoplanes sp. CA-015351 TaxID=3239897 RepID=UPI003D9A0435
MARRKLIHQGTLIEAVHARTHKARLNWVLSGLRVVPVGDEEARAASKLLIDAGCVRPAAAAPVS